MMVCDDSVSLLVLEGLCRDMRVRAGVSLPVQVSTRLEVNRMPLLRRLASRTTVVISVIGCLAMTLAELQARM